MTPFATKWLVFLGSAALAAALVLLLRQRPNAEANDDVELVVFCAAGLVKPVEDVRTEYQQRYGVRLNVSYDGSGVLLGKLRKVDLPCDLFIAAERSYIDDAMRDGLLDDARPVAGTTPVLAVRAGNPKNVRTIDDLLRSEVAVSLPDPDAAAIGRVTREVLRERGLWKRFSARIRAGDVSLQGTVNKSALDVKLGVADAAILWEATARQTGLEFVRDPDLDRRKETVTLGVCRKSEHPDAAKRFARYLVSRDRGQPKWAAHHYEPLPNAVDWVEP